MDVSPLDLSIIIFETKNHVQSFRLRGHGSRAGVRGEQLLSKGDSSFYFCRFHERGVKQNIEFIVETKYIKG